MKKNFKYIFSLVAVALACGFVACDEDDEYTPAKQESGAQVYFSNETPGVVQLPATDSVYSISVCRIVDDAALEVPVKVAASQNLFEFAKSVSFAAGEKVAKLEVKYDIDKVGFDVYDTVTVSIADSSVITAYGFNTISFVIGAPAPWTSLGKATFTDSWWAEKSYSVELQQNDIDNQMYRLVNPFADKSAYDANAADYFVFRIYKKGETLAGQVLDQDIVYYDDTPMVNHSSYNDVIYICHPSGGFKSTADQSTWTKNCVKVVQEDGTPAVVQVAPFFYMFNTGGWNYTTKDDIITITFPGVVILDLSAEIECAGRMIDNEGNSYAMANISLGEDVASAKVGICRSDTVSELVEAILSGAVESVEITESGSVQLPMPSEDLALYTVVVIPFDENGEISEKNIAYDQFRIYRAKNEAAWDLSTPKVGDYYFDYVYEGNDEGNILIPTVDADTVPCFVISGLAGTCDFTFYKDDNDSVWFEPQVLMNYPGIGDIVMYPLCAVKGYEVYTAYYDSSTGTFEFPIAFVYSGGVQGMAIETFTITGDYVPETPEASMYRGPIASHRELNITKLNLRKATTEKISQFER